MPRHFEEPPLFTLLSNTATNLLPSGCAEASLLTLPQQAVQDMIEHVWTLPDDTTGNTDLDMARYWGLAKIMEHFHAAIAGPKRAEVQDRLATTFAARRSADGLYVSSLKPELYPNMFLDIAQASVAELPAAQRLAAEAIDLVARIRLTKRQSRTADDVFPLGHMVHRVTTNTANASALSQNVTAGYLAVLGEALEQKYGGQ